MIINSDTKIAAILKQNPAALDAIISITPKFEKLRNPLLRKLMAGRTSIGMASKISGCSVIDFFKKLEAVGVRVSYTTIKVVNEQKPKLTLTPLPLCCRRHYALSIFRVSPHA